MKKTVSVALALIMAAGLLVGCGGSASSAGSVSTGSTAAGSTSTGGDTEATAMTGEISVISREEGSGTRGAFVELFGVEQKNAEGKKIDYTTDMAEITNSTAVMMTTVAGNLRAIGYVSLGSLSNTVKALEIDGAIASAENIKSGSYKISRPFNIATKGEISEAAQDFIDFIMSTEGQSIVENNGYISEKDNGAFTGGKASGKITVAGSSSVTPVMEKLKEAYEAINGDVSIEIQQNDSTTGMTSTLEGLCDIGMASRELKDSEKEAGLTPAVIALDGIAVIVNNDNTLTGLTAQQVCDIFTGEISDWSELG